ncbi:MAG TPA: RNA polymerase factor sigma-54, partial [Gammaproteobacteria bacterium]
MKQSLQLRLKQQLSITPQLQQAIKLLQLSSLDLITEIRQAVESNPLLEFEDNFDDAPPDADDSGTVENLAEDSTDIDT